MICGNVSAVRWVREGFVDGVYILEEGRLTRGLGFGVHGRRYMYYCVV